MDLELVRRFVVAKDNHHRAATEADEAKAEYRRLEAEVMAAMEAEQLKTGDWTLPGVGSVRITNRKPTIYGQILDPDIALDSINSAARTEELVTTKFQEARLNQFVNECITNKTPLPPGIGFRERGGITVTRRAK